MLPATIYMMWSAAFVKITINLRWTVSLPKIEMGDILVIHDTGAHGFAMGYNYNGRLKSAEILLKEDGTAKLIRRAETPKDYFATFDCFPIYDKLFE